MTKKYFAYGTVLSVVVGSQRFHFDACKDGSSYITSNEVSQKALESHPKFGKSFRLLGIIGEAPATAETPATEQKVKATIKVADISEAREYLATTFGYTRSSLRSKVAISEAANEHNIIFEGI